MSEPRRDSGSDVEVAHEPPPEPTTHADRRSFLRQLSTDAVWTAGKVAGASAALRRGLLAAGQSAIGTFEGEAEQARAGVEPANVSVEPPGAGVTGGPPAVASAAVVSEASGPAATPAVAADPVAGLTLDQHAFLVNGRRATLAVNDPTGHPLLAPSIYHWDGALIRLPARDFSARTIDIDRDPKVALLIEDPASGAWVAINAIASLVYGDQVEPETRLILSKYHAPDEVAGHWAQLRATGDQLVIRLRPTRFVWRSA